MGILLVRSFSAWKHITEIDHNVYVLTSHSFKIIVVGCVLTSFSVVIG